MKVGIEQFHTKLQWSCRHNLERIVEWEWECDGSERPSWNRTIHTTLQWLSIVDGCCFCCLLFGTVLFCFTRHKNKRTPWFEIIANKKQPKNGAGGSALERGYDSKHISHQVSAEKPVPGNQCDLERDPQALFAITTILHTASIDLTPNRPLRTGLHHSVRSQISIGTCPLGCFEWNDRNFQGGVRRWAGAALNVVHTISHYSKKYFVTPARQAFIEHPPTMVEDMVLQHLALCMLYSVL